MKIHSRIALAALAFLASYAYAESLPILSRAALRHMVRSAHTSGDYASLASYYTWREEEFKEQARAELVEWGRRSQFANGFMGKYPRPVDYSRIRYEYFTHEVQKMNKKAAYYEALAEQTPR